MSEGPQTLRIRLSDDRRLKLSEALRGFCNDRFDLELSEFQAEALLDFAIRELGAPIYNQAIADARRFVAEKLDDLEGEFYEPESGEG